VKHHDPTTNIKNDRDRDRSNIPMQTLFPVRYLITLDIFMYTNRLKIEASIKPVTALLPIQGQAFTSGLLFAGQGFNIQVQDTRSNRVLLNSQVFSNQIVHGIRTVSSSQALQALLSIQDPDFDQSCCSNTDHGTAIESHEVIIWGGRWIRRGVFAFCSKDGCVQLQSFWLSKPFECLDWILDICKDIGSQGAIAVTAHNDLLAIPPESLGVRVLGRGSRSILYSAHVMWKDDHTLLIAGGTAFGQILVQTCAFEGEIVTIRTHYVFSGHEGSIFGVRLSDPLPQPDRKSLRLLSSCSDDRTVRLWDVSDLSPLVASGTVDERETGFLASKTEDCLASGVGHISRVWSLRYIYHTEGTTSKSIIKIVSAGEDATCRVWDLRRHENSQYALEAVGVINNHAGKNIWSMEVMLTMDRPETCNIFTGGADGAILTSSVKSSRNPSDSDSSGTWDIQDISYLASSYATPDSTILQRECFRAMTLVQDGAILVASNEGQVFFSAPATNNSQSATLNTWTLIETIPGLKGYSVSASTASGSFAVIAGASGMVYCFDSRTQSLHEIYQAKRKVYALWIEQNPCSGPELRLDLVVFELGNDKTTLLHLNSVQPGSVQISGAFTADTYASTPTTAACCFKGSTQFLALGFRNGIIKIYNSNELPFTAAINHTEEPISLTTYAVLGNCGTETVTHLQWIYDEDTLYIASVGRDGYFSIHAVPTEGHSHPMLLHRLVLPFGPNVEGFWICPITSNLIVYGFHSTNMIVYNVSTAREVASITCGGAHRTWSLQINSARSPYGDMVTSCTFAWTQIRQLRRQQVSDANFRVLQPGGHGRDVKTCSTALVAILKNGDLTHLIATGAEDTDIRLFEKGQSKVECVATLRKHATGVRCLKWSSDGRYLFSSGGKEEFFVWRICQSPIVHCGIVCEAVLPVRDGGSELRIMSFDVNEQDNFRTDTAFVITLVYSNSVIKVSHLFTLNFHR